MVGPAAECYCFHIFAIHNITISKARFQNRSQENIGRVSLLQILLFVYKVTRGVARNLIWVCNCV